MYKTAFFQNVYRQGYTRLMAGVSHTIAILRGMVCVWYVYGISLSEARLMRLKKPATEKSGCSTDHQALPAPVRP